MKAAAGVRLSGGAHRGRHVAVPPGARPTEGRVREALFSIWSGRLDGARVLDLFAGTGALGLEALSRGAAFCLFVEEDAEARGLIRRNVEAFGLTGVTKIFRRDATDLGPAPNRGTYGLAFLDPPYVKGLAERALASAAGGGWLAASALVVVEERKGEPLAPSSQFGLLDRRTWGDTQVLFARFLA
jgi:16S rRNA (guanine966-N2)-methyltransferase